MKGLNFALSVVLFSFGVTVLGFSHSSACDAVCNSLREANSIACSNLSVDEKPVIISGDVHRVTLNIFLNYNLLKLFQFILVYLLHQVILEPSTVSFQV